MRSLLVKKGEVESNVDKIGHFSVSTLFVPATLESNEVYILGSHNGMDFGLIYQEGQELSFIMTPAFSVHVFNSSIFDGISAIKLRLQEPASEDLTFPIHVKDG